MSQLKLLIATGIYPPDIGGPATYSKLLHDELPKHNVSVEVLSFGEVRGSLWGVRHVRYFLKLLRHAPFCDVVYAQDPVSVGFPALIAAVFLRKRFVLKIVGDYAWEQATGRYGVTEPLDSFSKKSDGYPFFVRALKTIEALVARGADRVIVPSRYLKKIVTNWGVSKDKVVVVYNAFIDTTPVFQEAYAASAADERIIVSAGRLVRWKGFVTLISLIPKLNRHFPTLKLIIAGAGPDRALLENAIREVGAGSHVYLTGALPQEKLFKYIRNADVFVLNTSYEGFSHQLLEVMALGTPIVTTNVGGNPEIINDGENGLLVAPDDRNALMKAIERLLLDDELARKCSLAGKETVKRFTTERMLKETITALTV